MSNQMRKVLLLSLVLSVLTLVSSLAILVISGEFLSVISWVIVGLSAILMVILISLYIEAKRQEKELRAKVAYYKLVHKLREKAILDFYNKFGLKPQYNKDGKLLTPDEYLGIITKLDAKGKLEPSIYEMLGILPRFDENGKEIPQVLVLKHLIREIKKEGLAEIPKLKGLYKKGTKKEAEKKPEKKTEAKKEEKKAGKKSKGKDKINLWGGKLDTFEFKAPKGGDKKGAAEKKPEKKPEVASAPKAQSKEDIQPKVEKVFINSATQNQNETSSYLNKMWNEKSGVKPANSLTPSQSTHEIEEYGEGTFE